MKIKIYLLVLCALFLAKNLMAQTETEPNDTISQNTSLNTFTAPVSITGDIGNSPGNDMDFFKINLPTCGSWIFNVINPNGTPCDVRMHIYSAQNTNTEITGSPFTFNFNLGLPDSILLNCGQTMYVQIDQLSGTELGAYQLRVTQDNFQGFSCNNSFIDAALVPLDTLVQARLYGWDRTGAVDVDYYKVNVTTPGVLNINLSGINSNQRLLSVVYDSSFTIINSADAGNIGLNLNCATLLSSGTYYIKIYEHTGGCCSAGYNVYQLADDPFDISLSFDTSDVYEHNNTFETAAQIPLNTSFNAKLWGENFHISDGNTNDLDEDQDYYKISVINSGVLNIAITGVNANQRIMVDIFDSTYQWINRGDAGGIGSDLNSSTLLPPGNYYLRIYEHTGGCCAPGYNVYQLADDSFDISLSFDTSDVYEHNNTFETAAQIPLNTSFNAKLWGKNFHISDGNTNDLDEDQDYYKISVINSGVLNIAITGVNANQRIMVDIFDSTYQWINRGDAGGIGSDLNSSTLLAPGNYYIRIYEHTSGCCAPGYNVYQLADDPFNITLSFDTSDACEANNTFATACLKQITDTFQFKIIGANKLGYYSDYDIDIFKYSPVPGVCGNLSLLFTGIPNGFSISVKKYSTATANDTLYSSPIATNNSTTDSLTVTYNGLISGNDYYFLVSQNGGTTGSNIPIAVIPTFFSTGPGVPAVSPIGPITICEGSSVSLTSSTTTNITWSTGDTSTQIVVDTSGVYSVTVSDGNGCQATSNAVVVNEIQTVVPSITVNSPNISNTICSGKPATFTSSATNVGSNPSYQWKVNALGVPGATGVSFTSSVLQDNDVVSCQLISNAQCASPTAVSSNNLQMHVNPSKTASVSVIESANNVCEGKTIVFDATPVNGGNLPYYQWRVNGINLPQQNYNQYSTNSLANGDNLSVLLFSNVECLTNPTASSSPVLMNLTPNNFGLNFTASTTNLTSPPFDVSFTNSSSLQSNLEYTWYFGDGSSYTGYTPTVHRYPTNDTFTVTLVARDTITECASSLKKDNYITCSGGGSTVTCGQTASISPVGPINACIGGTIKLTCTTTAGSPNYQWNVNGTPIGGATQSSYSTSIPGFYSVTVFEDGACPVTSTLTSVQFNQAAPAKPVIISNGMLFNCSGGSVTLTDTVGFNNYVWSTGAGDSSITVYQSGIYTVTGFNSLGCEVVSNPIIINNSPNLPIDICQVTVDDASNKNIIVWEKPINTGIDSFIVYKESNAAGVFLRIGTLPYAALSEFEDATSNPAVRPDRYRIAIKDACGSQTLPGNINKTMHLQVTPGIGNARNLSWNQQEGLYFPSYIVMRKNSMAGVSNFIEIDTIPSSINTYTDI
ncbi:MAG TPA: PKD domain-containing protein, partial [Bacteroidia bacterium]|nr:PKD domain-containing protein [Bacteroidia bacterium]